MGFQEAIQSGFENFTNFSGRSGRPAYWYWALFAFLAGFAGNLVDLTMDANIVAPLIGLVLLLPGLAVAVRRLHDTNRSGWWLLVALVPFFGWIILLFFLIQPSDPEPNRFGPHPAGGTTAARA